MNENAAIALQPQQRLYATPPYSRRQQRLTLVAADCDQARQTA
ncbi:MAG: hypothetical protein ABFE08_23390 [Armatimonadia bacterium]